jgi:hypothetical protein
MTETEQLRNVYETVGMALAAKSCPCPHCGQDFGVAVYKAFARESLVRLTIKPPPGEFYIASDPGKMLSAFAGLMEAAGEDLGERAHVSLVGCSVEAGALEFHVLITRKGPIPAPPAKERP